MICVYIVQCRLHWGARRSRRFLADDGDPILVDGIRDGRL
jgi:hypothetical protein